jgi:hypothetical protein
MRDLSPSDAAQDDIVRHFNPLHSQFPHAPGLLAIEAIRVDEVERFSDGGASELDALCWQDSRSVEFGCYSHPVYR